MARFDPYESLGYHCSLTAKAFIGSIEANLKGTGVAPAQFRALANLIALGPLSQSELVNRLSVTRATGVRLIDRMERDGWVVRQPDPRDSRVKRVVLTEKANAVWDRVSAAAREVVIQAYRGVEPAEIEGVKRVLAQMRKNLAK